jgi:hypothetical protein
LILRVDHQEIRLLPCVEVADTLLEIEGARTMRV